MKLWLGAKASAGSGGMYRVYEGLYTHLPKHGIEIVDDKHEADVLNPHIGMWETFPEDKPIVLSSHGMLWSEHRWGKIANKVNKECLEAYRRADVVTAPSHFVARSISRYTGANPIVCHHGIDSDLWKPNDNQGYVLWNKARADAASDPADMNILAELAPNEMFYTTYGKETGNVFVFGNLSPDDMIDMVSHAGVYLALSKESGGPCFGVLEAMSSGVPILSWNFGGTAEVIIHKETGYLAKPYDYEDLLEGLNYCQQNRDRLGKNAYQHVRTFYQWDTVILDYIEAYDKALYGHNETVSVVIPCYNLGKFLPGCLDSVIEQTYPNLEIVVVDDASTDNSWEIIQDYAKKDSRILPIRHDINKHVSASRNTGIRYSNGSYILPLDADDRLLSNSVETLVSHLNTNRNMDIVAGKLQIYHETALDGPYQQSGWPNNTSLKLQLEGYNRLPYSSLYRRKVFDRVGGYRTRIKNGTEDADFWTRALSLGYNAEILEEPTLRYTYREQSLGKQNNKGSQVWLDWFPYLENESPARQLALKSFSPPTVSIIIPVGPGHTHFIQACIDSILAQNEDDWEIILINDTEERLENVPGFVRIVDYAGNRGVAYARNRGVEAALADKVVFLDVDDILQPHAIKALLAAHAYAGGWIYGDWYVYKGNGTPEYSESDHWDYNLILNRSLGPITGIYEKEHVLAVGGFNEELSGWEDWDFHLRLLHIGVCGTRIKTPLITYNMHLGWRREENFNRREDLLKYIHETHYTVLKEKINMACNKCGGKKTLVITNPTAQSGVDMGDFAQVEYLGSEAGRNRLSSKTHKGTDYLFSANKRKLHVFKSDIEWLLSLRIPGTNSPMFRQIVEEPTKHISKVDVVEEPLISEEIPAVFSSQFVIEKLSLEEHVIEKLHTGKIHHISDILSATDAELLKIKGIGPQRVDEIREAVKAWKST